VFNQPFDTNFYFFGPIQFIKMPTKNHPSSTDGSEDGSIAQPVKKKLQRGRLATTKIQDRPKRNASRPDKHNVSPLLAEYASAKTSKTAASLPPIYLGDNKTKSNISQSQGGGEKRMVRHVNSVTIPANMEGAADTLRDVAGTQLKSASTLATVMEVDEVQGATPSDTTEAESTKKIGSQFGNGQGGVTNASTYEHTYSS
jgi:hypothetical protein